MNLLQFVNLYQKEPVWQHQYSKIYLCSLAQLHTHFLSLSLYFSHFLSLMLDYQPVLITSIGFNLEDLIAGLIAAETDATIIIAAEAKMKIGLYSITIKSLADA